MCALIGVAVCGSAGCGLPGGDYFGKVDPEPDPTHLRWCNSGEPEFLDPALVASTTGLPLVYALFDGLTDYNLQGLPEPSLATHWEISPDQRRFTFHLHDRGRWSNGRAITAHDFAFHLERVLSPLSFSRNAEPLWRLKAGQLYTEGRVKKVLHDSPPFRAGDVVEVVAVLGIEDGPRVVELPAVRRTDIIGVIHEVPNSNVRTAVVPMALREKGAPVAQAYAIVPANQEVTLIDLDDEFGGESWAYVHWAEGDGVYGWVKTAQLTGQPNSETLYWVRELAKPHQVGVEVAPGDIAKELVAERRVGAVTGDALLTLPELIGIRVPDDTTLVLETWGPVPYFIDMTVQQAFRPTPREAVVRRPLRWTRPEHIITSGPFHLRRWHERDRIELRKSPTYWRRDQVKLERLTVYSMDDQAASTNYYMQGGCDAVASNNIPTSYLQALSRGTRGRRYRDFISAPYLGNYFYIINTEKLSNVHLRRALSHAIDRSPIPSLLHGGEIPTEQHTPGTPISQLGDADLKLCGVTRDTPGLAMIVRSGELCYVPAPGLEFDPAKARAELARARAELGDDFPESISLKFNTGVESHKILAEYMQHEWQQKLGLTIELSSQEWKTYLKDTVAGEYEIGRFGGIGNFPDPESEVLAVFKCNAPDNRTRFCNEDFERYFTAAEATSDRRERLALIRKAEEIVVAEAPVIPIYVYTQHQLQKPYVRDLEVNLSNKQPLYRAWIDRDWRKRVQAAEPRREGP